LKLNTIRIVVLGSALLTSLHTARSESVSERNPDGVPYEWIDAAPAVGVVRAVNPGLGFAVVALPRDAGADLRRGVTLGVRRDGVIVIWGVIDELEDARTLVLQLKGSPLAPDGSSQARVGDSVIAYPPKPPLAEK